MKKRPKRRGMNPVAVASFLDNWPHPRWLRRPTRNPGSDMPEYLSQKFVRLLGREVRETIRVKFHSGQDTGITTARQVFAKYGMRLQPAAEKSGAVYYVPIWKDGGVQVRNVAVKSDRPNVQYYFPKREKWAAVR